MTTETKGGRLAAQAGMLCADPDFGLYLDARKRRRLGVTLEQLPDGTHSPEDAADTIRQACVVTSRAQLDHVPDAAAMFDRIVNDYRRWRGRRGH